MPNIRSLLTSIRQAVFSGPFTGYEYADTVIRYSAIARKLKKSIIASTEILEIGSGAQGIAPYVPCKVTGLDTQFVGDIHPNLSTIRYSGTRIPFADRTFDIALSVDMLEHVEERDRLNVISEMMRVARNRLIIAVPCGEASAQQDRLLDEIYLQARGSRYDFLHEHVLNGLPEASQIQAMIESAATSCGRKVQIKTEKNFNIQGRYLLMRLWVDTTYYAAYLLVSLLFCILRKVLSYGTCYRQLFIVDMLDHEE